MAQATEIRVDRQKPLQTIEGFGAFGAQKVWWESAPYFDDAYLERIVDDLGSTLVRTQIYWDGEAANDDDDPLHFEWANFHFGPTSENGKQFEYLKALSARGVRIVASVWSPPPWMKEGADDSLAPFCHGQCAGKLRSDLRAEFAEYLLAYVVNLEEQTGVRLYALSLQNEPLFANPFESCVYTAAEYAETLEVVAGRFRAAGKSTKFFGPEHMGDYDWNQRAGLLSSIVDSPDVSKLVHAYAVHGYLNGFEPDYGDAEGWSSFADKLAPQQKQLWMTETSAEGDSSWAKAWDTVRGLHLALKFGKINAWIYWTYAGRLTADTKPLPLFHLFKPWYRFVRPGFVQVESASDDPALLVTAFQKDAELVLIVINNGTATLSAELNVQGGTAPARWQAYRVTEADGFVDLPAVATKLPPFEKSSITAFVHDGIPDVNDTGMAGSHTNGPPSATGPVAGRCGCRLGPERASAYGWLASWGVLALIARRRVRTLRPHHHAKPARSSACPAAALGQG